MTEPNIVDPVCGTGSSLLAADFNELRKPCWISYPRGDVGLRKLRDLIKAPPSHRPGGMLLYGDSNSGKTTLVRHFQNLRSKGSDAGDDDYPFEAGNATMIFQSPPYPSTGALLTGALRSLNAPHQETWHWEKKLDAAVAILSKTSVRMIVIDEIHNALTGPHDKRVHFLNTIKYLSNELRIPIVVIGTSLALSTIQTDQQLGSRLVPFKLPKWEADKEFAHFLGRIFMHLKVNPVPAINSRKFRERFIHMTDGLTGEIWNLAVLTAEDMHARTIDVVEEQMLVDAPWVRPQDRRIES